WPIPEVGPVTRALGRVAPGRRAGRWSSVMTSPIGSAGQRVRLGAGASPRPAGVRPRSIPPRRRPAGAGRARAGSSRPGHRGPRPTTAGARLPAHAGVPTAGALRRRAGSPRHGALVRAGAGVERASRSSTRGAGAVVLAALVLAHPPTGAVRTGPVVAA